MKCKFKNYSGLQFLITNVSSVHIEAEVSRIDILKERHSSYLKGTIKQLSTQSEWSRNL